MRSLEERESPARITVPGFVCAVSGRGMCHGSGFYRGHDRLGRNLGAESVYTVMIQLFNLWLKILL
jgi:hypothetical protein